MVTMPPGPSSVRMVKVGNTWKAVESVHVNIAGNWKTVEAIYANINGSWVLESVL